MLVPPKVQELMKVYAKKRAEECLYTMVCNDAAFGLLLSMHKTLQNNLFSKFEECYLQAMSDFYFEMYAMEVFNSAQNREDNLN